MSREALGRMVAMHRELADAFEELVDGMLDVAKRAHERGDVEAHDELLAVVSEVCQHLRHKEPA